MRIPSTYDRKASGRTRHPGLLLLAGIIAGSAVVPAASVAQGPAAYPSKPVRFVVGQSPGGATDIVARSVAQKLSENLGQNFLVENRTGAAGSIGATFVANSAPDGYNVLVVSSSYAINPSLYKNLPFDPIKDFAPVSLIAEAPFLLVVHPSMPVRSVKDLIALAKARKGELNFASGGNGSSGHLAGALFNFLAGTDIIHVPYKGAGPALVDVMSGQVHLTFASVLSSLPHVKNGRLRGIAVTSAKRSAAARELPTVDEAGVKGYRRTTWYGALAPAGTPAGVVAKLSAEVKKAMESPDIKQRFLADGAEPEGSTPKEFHDHLVAEIASAREIIQKAGVKR
jgi:tripartite-type tricarboxylate transporter receptor subunit TctC